MNTFSLVESALAQSLNDASKNGLDPKTVETGRLLAAVQKVVDVLTPPGGGKYVVAFADISTAGTNLGTRQIIVSSKPLRDNSLTLAEKAVVIATFAAHEIGHTFVTLPRKGLITAHNDKSGYHAVANLADDIILEPFMIEAAPILEDAFTFTAMWVLRNTAKEFPKVHQITSKSTTPERFNGVLSATRYGDIDEIVFANEAARDDRDWGREWADRLIRARLSDHATFLALCDEMWERIRGTVEDEVEPEPEPEPEPEADEDEQDDESDESDEDEPIDEGGNEPPPDGDDDEPPVEDGPTTKSDKPGDEPDEDEDGESEPAPEGEQPDTVDFDDEGEDDESDEDGESDDATDDDDATDEDEDGEADEADEDEADEDTDTDDATDDGSDEDTDDEGEDESDGTDDDGESLDGADESDETGDSTDEEGSPSDNLRDEDDFDTGDVDETTHEQAEREPYDWDADQAQDAVRTYANTTVTSFKGHGSMNTTWS